MGILVWFPSEYSGWLGNIMCYSSAAVDSDGLTTCYNTNHNNYVVIWGLKHTEAGSTITVTLHNVKNPAIENQSTGTFRVATIN
mmetsp:Transcript_26039/g.4471  ORF Transcript_26039/g.4471 Transcript_26039/m.4471 type:complete len:84 (-) Transcript_26039:2264-2515(-)